MFFMFGSRILSIFFYIVFNVFGKFVNIVFYIVDYLFIVFFFGLDFDVFFFELFGGV